MRPKLEEFSETGGQARDASPCLRSSLSALGRPDVAQPRSPASKRDEAPRGLRTAKQPQKHPGEGPCQKTATSAPFVAVGHAWPAAQNQRFLCTYPRACELRRCDGSPLGCLTQTLHTQPLRPVETAKESLQRRGMLIRGSGERLAKAQ